MAINRISLFHLETLLWIAQLGTFAAAAEKLNTTQPAISARIAELEERLGATLFQKHGRSSNLTPAGRQLVREYLPIWEQLQAVLLRSSGFGEIRGSVRIGAGEIAAASCLPPFIASMKEQWPDLTFDIEVELTAQMIQALLNGRIDLAFAAGLVAHPALKANSIGAAELLWIAGPSIAMEMATNGVRPTHALWSLPSHSPIYQLMRDALGSSAIPHRSVNLCNNVRAMIDIVAMGGGFALVPKSMVRRELGSGSLVQVLIDQKVKPIVFHVVTRAGEGNPVINEIVRRASDIDLDTL